MWCEEGFVFVSGCAAATLLVLLDAKNRTSRYTLVYMADIQPTYHNALRRILAPIALYAATCIEHRSAQGYTHKKKPIVFYICSHKSAMCNHIVSISAIFWYVPNFFQHTYVSDKHIIDDLVRSFRAYSTRSPNISENPFRKCMIDGWYMWRCIWDAKKTLLGYFFAVCGWADAFKRITFEYGGNNMHNLKWMVIFAIKP